MSLGVVGDSYRIPGSTSCNFERMVTHLVPVKERCSAVHVKVLQD